MGLSEKDFHILDALDTQQITTQRELAEHAGVSLGQVNYVLKSLLKKGFVKIGNFRRSSSKIKYVYHLTPKGIEARASLTGKFVMLKLQEYQDIRERLAEKLVDLTKKEHCRVFFVGPSAVSRLLDSIIREESLDMMLVGECGDFKDLKHYDQESFDLALLFDGNGKKLRDSAEAYGIPFDKLYGLW